MKKQIYQSMFTIILFITVCLITTMLIVPISLVLLLGVAAGISSAVILLGGTRQVFPLVLSSIIFSIYLHYYSSVKFELSIVLIFTLAICLQGIWAQKLTCKLVSHGQWLDNRKKLSYFIYKVGPLASLISAFSAVLLTILSAESFNISLLYVFFQTWSISILISIFGIPILLFLNTEQELNKGKRLFVIVSSTLGGLSIALLFKVGQDQTQYFRDNHFHQVHSNVELKLDQELQHINQELNALKAYFEASSLINVESFNQFSAYILNNRSKIEAFEWAPIVENIHRNMYEKYTSDALDILYSISKQTLMGNNIKSGEAPIYLPVQYVFPRYQNEHMLGIDLFSHLDKSKAIQKAIQTKKASATLPINIMEGDFSDPVIFIALPIFNYNLKPTFGLLTSKDSLAVSGVIIAVVRVSTLFENIMTYVDQKNINLVMTDVHNNSFFPIVGNELNIPNRLFSQEEIDFFSRKWSYKLSEKSTWILQYKTWQTWATLFGGTLGGVIFQLLILMMAAYSTELSHRVTQKTRELILSKEKSDNENQAKTDFLLSLSVELRVPLNVIKRLIEVFPKKKLQEKEKNYINNISSATLNLEQIIDTLNELSSIESGRLTINTQPFDFSFFLKRMEEMVEAQTTDLNFLIQEDVPQFIESDELRLQQIFLACVENSQDILENNNICIAVKVHFHHKNSATIVFALHVLKTNQHTEQPSIPFNTHQQGKGFNLRMEMAKELCNKLGGNINITQLPSGESMIHASVKVKISQELGFGRFNIPLIEDVSVIDAKRILFIEGRNKQNKNLYRQLISLKYYVEVINDYERIEEYLSDKKYHMIIFDCFETGMNIKDIPTPLKGPFSTIATVALFNQTLETNILSLVNHKFTAYIVLPIETENLRVLINNYIK